MSEPTFVDINPGEMGPDYEANKGRVIRDCTCGHRWFDHACWPTHIRGGECFRCGCGDFEEPDLLETLRRSLLDKIGRACDVCRGLPDHAPICPFATATNHRKDEG